MATYAALLSGEWTPVDSSWIRAARWDGLKGILSLRTDRGKVYDCPADLATAQAFFLAPSKGAFFNSHLRLRR